LPAKPVNHQWQKQGPALVAGTEAFCDLKRLFGVGARIMHASGHAACPDYLARMMLYIPLTSCI